MTTPVAGPAEAEQSDHADCGSLAADAWVQAFVVNSVRVPAIDNATAAQMASAINHLGIHGLTAVDEYPDDVNAYLGGHLPSGDGVMAGIRVNTWDCEPNPSGGVSHWVDPYPGNGNGVHFYNCWEATFDVTDAVTMQSAYVAGGVGCVRITFTPATSTQGVLEMAVVAQVNFKHQMHDFTLRPPTGGAVWHDWPGGTGEQIRGANHELDGKTIVAFDAAIDPQSGACRLLMMDKAGNTFVVHQGPSENVWSVEGEP